MTGVDLPGEKPGLIPDSDWKLATFGEKWQQGETLVAGIGQGFITTTPLQLALMTARIANGGIAITPKLRRDAVIAGEPDPPGPYGPALDIPADHLAIVKDGMNRVTNEAGGTAYRARIEQAGMEMAGKTGTAQVRRITMAERQQGVRKNEDLPWDRRDHALFVGYAPVHAPQYAVAVVVDHGGGGSKVAAPIARDILLEAQRRNPSRIAGMPDAATRGEAMRWRLPLSTMRRSELSIGEKLQQLNVGLLLLICAVGAVGVAWLYSAGGGSMEPWSMRHAIRFGAGLLILVVVAMVDFRLWLKYAYAHLWRHFRAAALCRGGRRDRHGRAALDRSEVHPAAAVGDDEDRAGAGAGALLPPA